MKQLNSEVKKLSDSLVGNSMVRSVDCKKNNVYTSEFNVEGNRIKDLEVQLTVSYSPGLGSLTNLDINYFKGSKKKTVSDTIDLYDYESLDDPNLFNEINRTIRGRIKQMNSV